MTNKLAVAAVAAFAFLVPVSHADQPAMRDALASLQRARASLERGTDDKGGHRAKAIRLVDEAIAQVKAGMRFDRRN